MAKKQIAKSEEQRRLLENLSAISAEFHSNEAFDKYYNRYADVLSGFPGIWNQMIVMARAFTSVESSLASAVDHEWIEAIQFFVGQCYDIKPGKGEYQRYKRAAKAAIDAASY